MKALIVGYGAMGREVERVLVDRGHAVVARIDAAAGRGDAAEVTEPLGRKAEVAIEFSTAEAVLANPKSRPNERKVAARAVAALKRCDYSYGEWEDPGDGLPAIRGGNESKRLLVELDVAAEIRAAREKAAARKAEILQRAVKGMATLEELNELAVLSHS